ncbi:MAG TPA: TIGR02206 family membrane protein [Bacilli bacterium]|nr:TIGR02206 family membrane protein [Bacilli bacterium]
MFNENLHNQLEMFSVTHLLTLAFFVLIIVTLYLVRSKISGPKFEKWFRLALGSFLLIFETSYHIWVYSRGGYNIGMLPLLGFCALTNLLTIIALLANKPKMFNYLIYYAIIGAFFSLIFIDTTWAFPHFRFFHYFLEHFGFLIASLYYYFTKKLTIDFTNFKRATALLFVYNLGILVVDLIFQENWFYLLENPVAAISDFFGAPFYTILWILFITLFMVFLYFLLRGFRREKKSEAV